MKITTTLNRIIKANWNNYQINILLNHIGHDYDPDKPINLLTILESNGFDRFLWALEILEQNFVEIEPILTNITADIAESVLVFFEKEYPNDDRPRKIIEAARYVNYSNFYKIKENSRYEIKENSRNAIYLAKKEAGESGKREKHAAKCAAESAKWSVIWGLGFNNILLVRLSIKYTAEYAVSAAIWAEEWGKSKETSLKEHKKHIEIIKKYLSWD